MLGLVFTEFLDMVERRWSPALLDQLLQQAAPGHGGSYTAVGYYPSTELTALVTALAAQTGQPVPALLQAFGEHLFSRFLDLYPALFAGQADGFALLASVGSHIHREVRKLYPDAELPVFTVREHNDKRLRLEYRSAHPLPDLADGLIRACLRHYRETVTLQRFDLPAADGFAGSCFELTRT